MSELLALASHRRHLHAGWLYARMFSGSGPDGITVTEFSLRLPQQFDALAEDFRSGRFDWEKGQPDQSASDDGTGSGARCRSVRDRVATGAIRSALREISQKEQQ
jgi:hypothetical protein